MWPWYAVTAMACFAAMQLAFTRLSRDGVGPSAMLLIVYGVGSLLLLAHVRVTRTPLAMPAPMLTLLIIVSVLSYIGNMFAVRALAGASNPGYASAIIGLQGAAVTIGAMLLLGSALSWTKGLGVLLCCAGIALLAI